MKGRPQCIHDRFSSSSKVTEVKFRTITPVPKSWIYVHYITYKSSEACIPVPLYTHHMYVAPHSVNVNHGSLAFKERVLPKSESPAGPGGKTMPLPLDAILKNQSQYVHSHDCEQDLRYKPSSWSEPFHLFVVPVKGRFREQPEGTVLYRPSAACGWDLH